MINFDHLITHFSPARTPHGTDYVYFSKLSPDARLYKKTLTTLVEEMEKSDAIEYEKLDAAYRVLRKIEFLQNKYNHMPQINSFHFSEYAEYQNIKNIDSIRFRSKLSEIEKKYTNEKR